VGDEVLRQFVRLVQGQLRETDSLVRYGGEEFLVILPDTPHALSLQVGERIRRAVEAETFPALPGGGHITVSAGIAEHRSSEGVDRTLSRVDVALYDAKNNGRNRTVSAM
jgi:diguanylate cyclase (GGDEF)-like protein